jgi:hypothetical protein
LSLNLGQLLSRNESNHLSAILGQLLESNGQLLGTERATLVDLISKAAQDGSISAVETNTVAFFGRLAVLLIEGLHLVQLDDSPSSPSGVGGQLVLDVDNNVFVHVDSLVASWHISSPKINFLIYRGYPTATPHVDLYQMSSKKISLKSG